MENNDFTTGEPDELVANLSTPVAQWGKLGDWKNGYGKYTVVFILLYAGYNLYRTGFPMITIDNWLGSFFIYAKEVLLLLIALYIYKTPFKNNKSLLVINSKGIHCSEETFSWNNILSFQLSLEKEMNNRYHAFYLHLQTKSKTDHKINVSMYNKKLGEIHSALLKNAGKNEVRDLGFTQMI